VTQEAPRSQAVVHRHGRLAHDLAQLREDLGASGAQLTWLRADLAATTAQRVLAFWHKRFTAGNYSDFTEFTPFWDALYTANADVVLSTTTTTSATSP
jgi:hypothetical protein